MVVTEVWRPKRTATPEQAKRAVALLRSGDWQLGKVWSDPNDPNVQYRAAMHPNVGKPGEHPGVEVWERVQGPAALPASSPPGASPKELVLREFSARGWPADEADAMIAIESGWDPSAHNKQRFGGLIGFNPAFATRHVGSPEALWALSIREQAPLVGKYLDEAVPAGKRWKYPGDTYLTGAAPAFIGASDWTVVYKRGSKAWEQNPGWRGADGEITAGSIRGVLLRKLARMKGAGEPEPSPKEPPAPDEPPPEPVPSYGSAPSGSPPGISRARIGGAIGAALAAIGSALNWAADNSRVTIALAVVFVALVVLALWLRRK